MSILNLVRSRLRKRLLILYFSNPEKEFYLRELEKLLGFSVGNIRRELNQLKDEGIFKKEKKGNLLYYSLNLTSPLYNELRSLIAKTIGIEELLRKILIKIKGLHFAFIYGSFARGEGVADSDIDLFLIGSLNEIDLIKGLRSIEKQTKRVVNYTIYAIDEFKDSVRNKDSFIMNILKGKKIFLKGTHDEFENIY